MLRAVITYHYIRHQTPDTNPRSSHGTARPSYITMFSSLFALFMLLGLAQAAVSSKSYCRTVYRTASRSVVPSRTRTVTLTTTYTLKAFSIDLEGITPAPITRTETLEEFSTTTRTADQETENITDTLYFNETATQFSTTTTTDTFTEYSTSTTTTTTTPSYIPIKLDTDIPAARKRALATRKQAFIAPAVQPKHALRKRVDPDAPRYPRSVVCSEVFQTSTVTVETTKLRPYIWRAPTPSSVETVTSTVIDVVDEEQVRVTSTITESVTSTATITEEVEEISTTTSTIVETATDYARDTTLLQCSDDNLLSSRNGFPITGGYQVTSDDDGQSEYPTVDNASECCQACLSSDACGAFFFQANSKTCYNFGRATCRPDLVFFSRTRRQMVHLYRTGTQSETGLAENSSGIEMN